MPAVTFGSKYIISAVRRYFGVKEIDALILVVIVTALMGIIEFL